MLKITQGDTATLILFAKNGQAELQDLTGAVFETKLVLEDQSTTQFLVLDNSAHTAAADQVANKGKFTLDISAADSALIKPGVREVVTKIVQGSSTIYYRGKIMTVYRANPES